MELGVRERHEAEDLHYSPRGEIQLSHHREGDKGREGKNNVGVQMRLRKHNNSVSDKLKNRENQKLWML